MVKASRGHFESFEPNRQVTWKVKIENRSYELKIKKGLYINLPAPETITENMNWSSNFLATITLEINDQDSLEVGYQNA